MGGLTPFFLTSRALGIRNPPSCKGPLSIGSFLGSPVSISPPFVTFSEAFPTLLSICQKPVRPGRHFIIWTVLKDTDAGIPFQKTPFTWVCGVTRVTWLHIRPPGILTHGRGEHPALRPAPGRSHLLMMASTSLCPGQGSPPPLRPPLPPVSPGHLTLDVPGAEPVPSCPSLGKQVHCLPSCPAKNLGGHRIPSPASPPTRNTQQTLGLQPKALSPTTNTLVPASVSHLFSCDEYLSDFPVS